MARPPEGCGVREGRSSSMPEDRSSSLRGCSSSFGWINGLVEKRLVRMLPRPQPTSDDAWSRTSCRVRRTRKHRTRSEHQGGDSRKRCCHASTHSHGSGRCAQRMVQKKIIQPPRFSARTPGFFASQSSASRTICSWSLMASSVSSPDLMSLTRIE